MEDYVFVKIVKMEETNNNNNINFYDCNFETIHFNKIGTAEHNDVPITKEYSNVLRETLPGLPLAEKWNTKSKSLVLYQNHLQSTSYLLLRTKRSKSTYPKLSKRILYVFPNPYLVQQFPLLIKRMVHCV